MDHALMEHARLTGHSVLRVYEWSRPVLSLGVNQRARGVYDLAAVERRGIEVVRRPTGGRALLHHREVTYAVAAPVTTGEGLAAMYRRVNDLLVSALSLLGVRVSTAAPSQRAATPSPRPCFAEPAKGELVVDGRKLVGSAQWRDAGAALQHGSMLVEDDQSLIPTLMHEPPAPVPPPATLRDILGRSPTAAEVADVLVEAVRTQGDEISPLEDFEDDGPRVDALVAHYADPSWTWRR
ncbi:MAG TPA: hypothetical protein VF929_02165 [Gemmatimonadaceae bacterium]